MPHSKVFGPGEVLMRWDCNERSAISGLKVRGDMRIVRVDGVSVGLSYLCDMWNINGLDILSDQTVRTSRVLLN